MGGGGGRGLSLLNLQSFSGGEFNSKFNYKQLEFLKIGEHKFDWISQMKWRPTLYTYMYIH